MKEKLSIMQTLIKFSKVLNDFIDVVKSKFRESLFYKTVFMICVTFSDAHEAYKNYHSLLENKKKLTVPAVFINGEKLEIYPNSFKYSCSEIKEEPIVEFILVDKPAFDKFIKYYPNTLEYDVTGICEPPMGTYNDFILYSKWPESIVAKIILYDGGEYHNFKTPEYFIRKESYK